VDALVLIAEDDADIADILRSYLEREGLRTVHAGDGRSALDLHLALRPDLVLLDVMMPRLDGWGVLAELRRRGQTPVIMLTALDQDLDKLQGLRTGADDYVVKPFNPLEVVARVRVVLRRARPAEPEVLRVGRLRIDRAAHLATVETAAGAVPVSLTLTEFRILLHLAENPTRVHARSAIIDAAMPDSDALDRTVDSHVSNLRRKLELAGMEPVIANVRGLGYRFAAQV
jgi:two-component system, OmpR family, response regulator AdeR